MTLYDELPKARLYGGGGSRHQHAGLVRGRGRCVEDDNGVWHPFGATAFPLFYLLKHDRPRMLANMNAYEEEGVDTLRPFGEVGGESWADRVVDPRDGDYEDCIADGFDTSWARGFRLYFTIFAGGTAAPVDLTLDKVIRVLRPRQHMPLAIEVANEDNFPGTHEECRRAARRLREVFPGMLVTLHTGETAEAAKADLDVVNALTIHLDRKRDVKDWRQPTQSWGLDWPMVPGINGEPAGPKVSVETLDDPLRLAALFTVGVFNGLTTRIFHSGAATRLGGMWDRAGGPGHRDCEANVWEIPRFKEICAAIRAASARLPLECPNWTKTSQSRNVPRADNPLYADAIWSDPGNDHGVHRNYTGYSGSEFVTLPLGVLNYVEMIATRRVQFTVYSLLDGSQVGDEVVLESGGRHRLPGDGGANVAYIIVGTM